MKAFFGLLYSLFSLATAMIGYTIHHSLFWSIMDFCFTFFAWTKWLIYHEVSMTIIHNTFAFFLQ